MGFDSLVEPSVGLVAFTSSMQLIVKKGWINAGLLVVQYVGVFILLGLEWNIGTAITNLIAGWAASVIILIAIISTNGTDETKRLKNDQRTLSPIFYLLTTVFLTILVCSANSFVLRWIPGIGVYQAWGGSILIGLGILRISFSSYPTPLCIGLLTFISGFEILYAAIDSSLFAAGSLAAITLGLGMVGAYQHLNLSIEDER